jgi:hypothetical protein
MSAAKQATMLVQTKVENQFVTAVIASWDYGQR